MSFENRDTKPAKVHSKGDIRLEQPMQKSPQRVAHRAESPDFSSKYTYHYTIQNLKFHAKYERMWWNTFLSNRLNFHAKMA